MVMVGLCALMANVPIATNSKSANIRTTVASIRSGCYQMTTFHVDQNVKEDSAPASVNTEAWLTMATTRRGEEGEIKKKEKRNKTTQPQNLFHPDRSVVAPQHSHYCLHTIYVVDSSILVKYIHTISNLRLACSSTFAQNLLTKDQAPHCKLCIYLQ